VDDDTGPARREISGSGDRARYRRDVSPMRRCSRTACSRTAVMTLTYVYADSTAVLGPLATYAEPHCYDLCEVHGERLTAPRGWEIVRLAPDPASLGPSSDDLEALADAVREAGRPVAGGSTAAGPGTAEGTTPERGRRGHLWVLPPLEESEA
jgi:hypothetical protein